MIRDEFTNILSRERRYQLRHQRDGLCHLCSRKKVTAFHCLEHAINVREAQRTRNKHKRRNVGALTYRIA